MWVFCCFGRICLDSQDFRERFSSSTHMFKIVACICFFVRNVPNQRFRFLVLNYFNSFFCVWKTMSSANSMISGRLECDERRSFAWSHRFVRLYCGQACPEESLPRHPRGREPRHPRTQRIRKEYSDQDHHGFPVCFSILLLPSACPSYPLVLLSECVVTSGSIKFLGKDITKSSVFIEHWLSQLSPSGGAVLSGWRERKI